jgi:hypothetical protein
MREPTREQIEKYLEKNLYRVLDAIRYDDVLIPDPKELPYKTRDALEVARTVRYVALSKIVGAAAHRYYRRKVRSGIPHVFHGQVKDYDQLPLEVTNDRIIILYDLIRAMAHIPIKAIVHAYYQRFGGFEFVRTNSLLGVALPSSRRRASGLSLRAQYVHSIAHDLAMEGVAPSADNILEIIIAVEEAKTGHDINHRTRKRWQDIVTRQIYLYNLMYPVRFRDEIR